MRSLRPLRFLLLAACSLPALGCPELAAGPCSHTYRDPVLAIITASDAVTGARVSPLLITDVTAGGLPQSVGLLMALTNFGVEARGDTIVCGIPCGFGTREGAYDFTASAPGYAPRRVSVEASFARFHGGCPSYNAGSTRTGVRLTRS